MTSYVTIKTDDWAKELELHIAGHFSGHPNLGNLGKDEPKLMLMPEYIKWAKQHYEFKEVPSAFELAQMWLKDSQFIEQDSVYPESNYEQWRDYCIDHEVLFYDSKYACISDGNYEAPRWDGQPNVRDDRPTAVGNG